MAGTDWLGMKVSQRTRRKSSTLTYITGGPVGAQRNNTFWIGDGLRAEVKVRLSRQRKNRIGLTYSLLCTILTDTLGMD